MKCNLKSARFLTAGRLDDKEALHHDPSEESGQVGRKRKRQQSWKQVNHRPRPFIYRRLRPFGPLNTSMSHHQRLTSNKPPHAHLPHYFLHFSMYSSSLVRLSVVLPLFLSFVLSVWMSVWLPDFHPLISLLPFFISVCLSAFLSPSLSFLSVHLSFPSLLSFGVRFFADRQSLESIDYQQSMIGFVKRAVLFTSVIMFLSVFLSGFLLIGYLFY